MPSRVNYPAHHVSVLSREERPERDLHRAWEALAARSDPIGAVYRCPAWFDHLSATGNDIPLHVLVIREADQVKGVAPLGIRRIPIEVHAGGFSAAAARVRVVDLFGGQPLVPEDPAVYDFLFTALGEAFPDCDGIRLADIPADGRLFDHLFHAPGIRDQYLVYADSRLAPYQTLPLPDNFAKYLAQFPRKKRYNLGRQENLLKEAGGGRIELRRCERPEDIAAFAAHLAALRPKSKHPEACNGETAGRHADMAARGLLRCYTLFCGDAAVAAMVGYQFGTTYTVETTYYDLAFARYSPGTTMMHLAIKDLLGHRPVNLIDFGYGKPSHDRQPPRVAQNYSKVLLLKKTLPNRVACASTRAFHSSVRLAQAGLRRLLRR